LDAERIAIGCKMPSPGLACHAIPAAADAAHRRDLNLVIVDATTGRPLQAVRLGC